MLSQIKKETRFIAATYTRVLEAITASRISYAAPQWRGYTNIAVIENVQEMLDTAKHWQTALRGYNFVELLNKCVNAIFITLFRNYCLNHPHPIKQQIYCTSLPRRGYNFALPEDLAVSWLKTLSLVDLYICFFSIFSCKLYVIVYVSLCLGARIYLLTFTIESTVLPDPPAQKYEFQ